jgi:Ca-activated chloride channel homolog
MFFSSPWCLVLMAMVIPILWFGHLRVSTLAHTKVSIHKNLRNVPLVAKLPRIFLVVAWMSLCLAMSRPILVEAHNTANIESRDIVISLDVSGSMQGPVTAPSSRQSLCVNPLPLKEAVSPSATPTPTTDLAGETSLPARKYTRLDAARDAALMFVSCREGDRVGYQPFAEKSYTGWPLTADLQVVYTMISLAGDYTGTNTNFDGPVDSDSRMGALQAAINHFKELGHAETRVLVLVTDGEDSIVQKRFDELVAQMRDLNIHIYVLGVGDAWTTNSTQDLRKFVDALGGVVIPVNDADQMRAGFERISQLEKSSIVIETAVTYREVYYWFLYGLAVFGLLFLLSSALFREDM